MCASLCVCLPDISLSLAASHCPLPSSSKPKAPGKDRRAFGTRSHMNFSFTSLRQLSLSLALSLYHRQVLSPAQTAIAHLVLIRGGGGKHKSTRACIHTFTFAQTSHVACRQSKQLLDDSSLVFRWFFLFVCLFAYLFIWFRVFLFLLLSLLLLWVADAGYAETGQRRAEESLLQRRAAGENTHWNCARRYKGEQKRALCCTASAHIQPGRTKSYKSVICGGVFYSYVYG